jgi:hypothetical protein
MNTALLHRRIRYFTYMAPSLPLVTCDIKIGRSFFWLQTQRRLEHYTYTQTRLFSVVFGSRIWENGMTPFCSTFWELNGYASRLEVRTKPLQFFVRFEECEHSSNVDRLARLVEPICQWHCKRDPCGSHAASGILSNTFTTSISVHPPHCRGHQAAQAPAPPLATMIQN